jgi:hypothetical protein
VRWGASLLLFTAVCWLGSATLPRAARATDLDEYQRAVTAYDAHD